MIINPPRKPNAASVGAMFGSNGAADVTLNKILEGIPASERAALWSVGTEVELGRGEVLVEADAPFEYVWFPEEAVASLVTDIGDGNTVESGTVGNEGFVGIAVFLGAESCPQRIIAQIPGKACRVPADAFRELLPDVPEMSALLNRYVLAYLAQVSQTAACNSQHTILQRCARWILLTHDRVGGRTIPLTQEFLAYMLGVRRPSVTVAQAELQRDGYIQYTRGKMHIVDRTGLEKISCECYGVVRDQFAGLLGVAVG